MHESSNVLHPSRPDPAIAFLLFEPTLQTVMNRPETSQTQRDFLRVARFGTAVAFGLTGGVLAAVKNSGSGLVLEFNFWVVPAILLGAAVAWAYWHFILTRVIDRPGGSNKRFVLYTALLGFLGLLCFLYPIRYVARGSMSDVLQGVFMAFVVVGIVACLIWAVARLLNAPPPPPRVEDDEEL